MSSEQERAEVLARVEATTAALAAARAAEQTAGEEHQAAIRAAVSIGLGTREVARVAGVSPARVSALAPRASTVQTRFHAHESVDEHSCVTDSGTVPEVPGADVPLLSGLTTVRRRQPYGRQTAFYATDTGAMVTEQGERVEPIAGAAPGSVAHVVGMVEAAGALLGRAIGRVYLTGPAPLDTSRGATIAEAVRSWAMGDPGGAWSVASSGHYLGASSLPILRFTHTGGARVTIMRAAAWWGESDASPETCAAAWRGLGMALDRVPAFAGAGLADTPATAGRALWLRTIPEGKGYPVMSDEVRELIASTTGQGRIELRPRPEPAGPAEGFTVVDGRLMYAALTWGMPVGEPRRWTGAEVDALDAAGMERTLRGRGRWRVTVQVPAGWAHVGILPSKAGNGTWEYPAEPGRVFTTWADGAEVWAAMAAGWEPVLHEGLTWDEGKPLDAWRNALVKVWEQADASGTEAGRLAARAIRSLILYALGAFASRAHPVTRSAAPEDVPDDLPAGTEVRRVGDVMVWQEHPGLSSWQQETAHPEWSATVWARARVRLLTGPGAGGGQVGALHLDPARVVAFATDALYLAGDPGWADDGKPGRFRMKGHTPGRFAWPATFTELYALRDRAEDGESNA